LGLSTKRRSGRPWKDELTQLEIIARYFIKPLLDHKPEELSDHVYLEAIFATTERLIGKYQAKKTIEKIPGPWVEGRIRIQGIGYRKAPKGTIFFVRHDIKKPNAFEVSFIGGQHGQELCYELTRAEWLKLQPMLEPLDHDARILRLRDELLK
jgi:hypothetical protein